MSILAAPNGPHPHTRELTINHRMFAENRYTRSPVRIALFRQHFIRFSNVQDLTMNCSPDCQTFGIISIRGIFGHLSGTLRSLSIHRALCSPKALMSLIVLFQHLEHLELTWVSFNTSGPPHPTRERRTLKGTLVLGNWDDTSEEFVNLLAEHDLRYRDVYVDGEFWLRDTAWNRFLVKCADNLEGFCIHLPRSQGLPTNSKYKGLTFKNLRKLILQVRTMNLPPPEFLSSITSKKLSEITVDLNVFQPGEGLNRILKRITSYDGPLCQLSDQLEPSPGNKKLVFKLRVAEPSFVPDTVLPRFSNAGVLKIVGREM